MTRTWIILAGIVIAAALVMFVAGLERGSAPGIVLFAGRFHPTIVHFPIAFLLLGAGIEILAPRWTGAERLRPAVPYILGLGAFCALAAAGLGYLLSLDGGYDPGLLSLHMWLGFGVFAVSLAIAAASAFWANPGWMYRAVLGALVVLVVVTGHLGGSLARGSDYLTYYLPAPVKKIAGLGGQAPTGLIANVDSALVFGDVVQPILDRRCVKCHGATKSKGDLRLDSRDGLEAGGREGPLFTAGNPARSEIIRRITLPPFDDDAMPPDGEPPLDVGETEVIRWWIQNGASFDARVAELEDMPSAVATYLRRVTAPQTPTRSGIYALDVPEADSAVVVSLRDRGLLITRLDPEAPFLEVSATNIRGFCDSDLESLRPIAPQISRLDLARTRITSASGAFISEMPHLTHLYVEHTEVDGGIIRAVQDLEYLEYLNLFGTRVGDDDILPLADMKSLESVYLWQTDVTPEGAAALRRARPGLYVNLGEQLAAADSTK